MHLKTKAQYSSNGSADLYTYIMLNTISLKNIDVLKHNVKKLMQFIFFKKPYL